MTRHNTLKGYYRFAIAATAFAAIVAWSLPSQAGSGTYVENLNANLNANANRARASVGDVTGGSVGDVAGGTGGTGGAGGAGGFGGNSYVSTTVTDSGRSDRHYSGGYDVKSSGSIDTTPSIALGTGSPSAPCIVPLGAGGSITGFGFAINGYKMDDFCDAREDLRVTHMSGKRNLMSIAEERYEIQLRAKLAEERNDAPRERRENSRTIPPSRNVNVNRNRNTTSLEQFGS